MSVAKETKVTKEQAIDCNLEFEFTDQDEKLISSVNLIDEQLKLKNADKPQFWKSICENVRSDLKDLLEDNQEVADFFLKHLPQKFHFSFFLLKKLHRLKDMMEEENRELEKETLKLEKVCQEASEICKTYAELN